MKSGKRVLGIIIVSLLLISSVSLVSAGIKDWFGFGDNKDLEGELPAAFSSQLTVGGNVPNISNWPVPDENTGAGGVGFTPNCGGVVSVSDDGGTEVGLRINISDNDGCVDLAEGDAVVTAYLSRVGQNRPVTAPATNATCTESTDHTTCTGTSVVFTCQGIDMNYWDVNAADWVIHISVNDGSGRYDGEVSSPTNPTRYPYLTYGQGNCIVLADSDDPGVSSAGGIAQDTVSFGTVNPLSTDINSAPDLRVFNDGNTLYNGAATFLQITGAPVNCTSGSCITIPADSINASSFGVDEIGPSSCSLAGNVNLTHSPRNIIGANLPVQTAARNFATDYEELFFCLEQVTRWTGQVDSLDSGTYTSSAWNLGTCIVGC